MKYVSAKYNQWGGVVALGDDGENYHLASDNSDVAPWPEYLAEGGTIEPADPIVEPVPEEISDRQFFQQLAVMGMITQEEALSAVKTGEAPQAFLELFASLPEAERFNARMLLEGATIFKRSHPITVTFGAMHGMTPAQIDDLWRAAAAL